MAMREYMALIFCRVRSAHIERSLFISSFHSLRTQAKQPARIGMRHVKPLEK